MSHTAGYTCALLAGLLAALASVCGKGVSVALIESEKEFQYGAHSISAENVNLMFRCFCIVGYILANVIMWKIFIEAMRMCPATMHAVVINAITNLAFTALFGVIFYNEAITMSWFLGFTLLCTGVIFMVTDSTSTQKTKKNL